MTEPVYKFDIHLLQLSRSDHVETAKTEWREIYREQRPEKTGLCICQHTLKNIIYMYNIYTTYTISVGTGCCKKFNLKLIKLGNNILENVMREMLIKGEYTIIDNILEYTNSIQSQLLKYIKTEYEHCLKSLDKLKKLHNDIKVLIENYEMAYLLDIYHELTDKIIREEYVNFERKEKERSEIERRRKEHAEVERREIERAEVERREIEHMEVERKEREIVEKMSCACGIIKVNVCMCNTPKYELVKLSNNLYCIRCSKWKCRC